MNANQQQAPATMQAINSGYDRAASDWTKFLECWRNVVDQRLMVEDRGSNPRGMPSAVNRLPGTGGSSLLTQRTLAAERRIGLNLPTSYKDFIAANGGGQWFIAALGEIRDDGSVFGGLAALEDIGWYNDVDAVSFKLWHDSASIEPIKPEVYYRYGFEVDPLLRQNPVQFSVLDLKYLLLIGQLSEGIALLLNSRQITSDGEMEAWVLDSRTPGATRYRSFAEMALAIAIGDANDVGPVLTPPRALDAFPCAKHIKVGLGVTNLGHGRTSN